MYHYTVKILLYKRRHSGGSGFEQNHTETILKHGDYFTSAVITCENALSAINVAQVYGNLALCFNMEWVCRLGVKMIFK